MMQWHVYEDWTLEEIPRCFYVGKGDDGRVLKIKRNPHHSLVSSDLGHRRTVVLTTSDENEALIVERELIQKRHTHPRDPEYNGIGCNRTLGGQGNSGRIVSEETKKRISEAKRGKTSNKVWTQSERAATAARMSALHKGKKISTEHKEILRTRMANPIVKNEMIAKISAALHSKYADDPAFHQRVREARVGSRNSQAVVSEFDVLELRQLWSTIDSTVRGSTKIFCQSHATRLNVTPENVYGIVMRRSWKHLP